MRLIPRKPKFKLLFFIVLILIILVAAVFSLPTILSLTLKYNQTHTDTAKFTQFPITVNPKNKTIVENVTVNEYLKSADSPLQAATGNVFWNTFEWLATSIADMPWYQSLAAVDGHFVTITAGLRKEQVVSAFTDSLKWNKQQKLDFVTPTNDSILPFSEGSFSPGVYFVSSATTPATAQTMINKRFTEEVLAHYSTSTAEIVPIDQALTVASLIQRETGGNDDMRLISGIIWNRIFVGMKLQLDATLQYAKANNSTTGKWWPTVIPADKYRKSLYNTYLHTGLPPTPIANPSVAAIVAALNPVKTSCIFYFHDATGVMHCSDTYAEHVLLLKKYFGQGK